jgi:folate-dependent phosphoribosylglycinamide formyltransferase PurN
VKSLAPELIVVAAYGKILPEDIAGLSAVYGAINVHSSLLPKLTGELRRSTGPSSTGRRKPAFPSCIWPRRWTPAM